MGLLDSIGGFLGDEENRLRLAQGFAGMTMNPNNPQIMAGIQSRLAGIQKQRASEVGADKLQKQTAMALQMLGDKFPMLSQALEAGIITPNDAVTSARKGSDVKVVGKSLVDSTGKVLFTSEDASGGQTTAFQTLHQKALAGGLTDGTPEYQKYMLEGGAKKGLSLSISKDGTIQMTQGGATPIKLTETQGKATGFYDRANKANALLTGLEGQGTKVGARILAGIPLGAGNFAQTTEYQQFDQAKRDFINAVLRQESGAAIAESEFENAEKQYFPQAGDKPEVIAQKRRNRETSANALRIVSGAGATALDEDDGILTWNPEKKEFE